MRCSLIMLCNWHQHQHHIMLIISSITPLHFLCHKDWNEVWHEFLVMCCHWHWHEKHMMLMALSMAQLCLLCQDDLTELQHDFSGHVMPLALMLLSSFSKAPLQSLHQDNKKEEHDFLVIWHNSYWPYMLPLVLVSHNATDISVSVTWC